MFKQTVKPLLARGFEVIEVYDDGTGGSNEVACVRLAPDDREVVVKTMLAVKKYHQRRKALTEVVFYLLDVLIGGRRVVPDLYAELYSSTPAYTAAWGARNPEGHQRVCQVVRDYAPGGPGDEWRGAMYADLGDLSAADEYCQAVIEAHRDAEKISLLDFLTINQDRSARNWVTDRGISFYAIDNGMAWFHEYPNGDGWKQGCVIDDVLLQREPWQFISGVFTTSWAGRPLSEELAVGLSPGIFDETAFLRGVDVAATRLGFPAGMSQGWRFEGILRRLRWIAREGRQPSADEYRAWRRGSDLFTPPEIVASGGQIVWRPEWDRDTL